MKWEIRKEKLALWFVWKLPSWIIYWSSIRLGAHAACGKHGNTVVPELKFMDALQRWEKRNEPAAGRGGRR